MNVSMAFFSAAEQVELGCEALYRKVAERFPPETAFRALLLKIAREEVEHASRLRLLSSLSSHDQRLAVGAQISIEGLRALLVEIRFLEGSFLDQEKSLSEIETRHAIIVIERRLALVHADAIVAFADEKVRRLFEELALADKGHAQVLADS